METDSQSQTSEIDLLSVYDPSVFGIWVISIVLIVLLVASWAFSGAKVAYFSYSEEELSRIRKKGLLASRLEKIIRQKEELYFLLQAINGMIRIGMVILFVALLLMSGIYKGRPDFGLLTVTIFILVPMLLIAERSKLHASRKPITFLRLTISGVAFLRPLYRLLFKPFTKLSALLDRSNINKSSLSLTDLSEALDLDDEKADEEKKILAGIVKFGQIEVKEVMKSRVDIFAVEHHFRFRKLLEVIIESGYSRMPVIDQSLDQVKGILYIKDILPYLNEKDDFAWQELIRQPYFIPENKYLDDLLEEFRNEKNHMAVVVDEYGGTAGLITLEDILEEIVGEITDEMDQEESTYSILGPNHYLFEAKTSLNDFLKILKEEDDYFDDFRGSTESLAGLLLETYGMIPEKGAEVRIRDYRFKIRSADNRRIKQIEVYAGQ